MKGAKKLKKNITICLVCICLMFTTACGNRTKNADADTGYHISYINKDVTRIIEKTYQPKETKQKLLVQELLDALSTEPESVDYRKPIPNGVNVLKFNLKKGELSIYFNEAYDDMNAIEEVLCRAAVVRTLTQVKGVDHVRFYVEDKPLKDRRGNKIGSMTADDFVENPGEQINSIQVTTLNLFFADESGENLVKVERKVHYSSNIAIEKLVVEELLQGPKTKGLQATIPTGTNIVGVTTTDGVCYVNLDDGFLNQNYGITEQVVVYSIVDSLTELPTVDRVQISINGKTKGVYRNKMQLNTLYEQNLEYVKK